MATSNKSLPLHSLQHPQSHNKEVGPLNDFLQICHSVLGLHVFDGRWRGGRVMKRKENGSGVTILRQRQPAYYLLLEA